jgi:hypothetical protein
MIIKFQEGDSWVLFGEIDHLEYSDIPHCEPHCGVTVSGKVILYDPPNTPAVSKAVQVSFFTKNMNEATIIHAYSPIYIMNDQGRTVETI